MNDKVIGGLLQVASEHFCVQRQSPCADDDSGQLPTITTCVKIDNIANADIDDSKEALVLLLELLLVKDLNGENAVLSGSPSLVLPRAAPGCDRSYAHIKDLVPVRVERLLDNRSGPGLFATNRGDSERVGKA